MRRRDLLRGSLSLSALLLSPIPGISADVPAAKLPAAGPFDASSLRRFAAELATRPYQPPESRLPDPLSKLTYDQYRTIRFDPAKSLWRGQKLPFEAQFFHRGFLYANRVDIFEVSGGQATPIAYNPDYFDFGALPRPGAEDIGFAGFRLHAPINRGDYYDEVCVFLGASYFRAVGKGQTYGLSARGLSIKTGDPSGEEFPVFKAYWLERPTPAATSLVIHALLDSPSATAAFRFTVRPGDDTVFDVEMTLYPRTDLGSAGFATMTSMFYYDANSRAGIDDYRPAVHDSDGLQMLTAHSENLWRPLTNPATLQVSAFVDPSPRGFGLMQRKRDFQSYDDLEARYEARPSLWVEPIGDPGEGAVELIEIPTKLEIHDNVVAFWRPKQVLRAKQEYTFTYRLHWCAMAPIPNEIARVVDTRAGVGAQPGSRLFVLEAAGPALRNVAPDAKLRIEVSADHGKVINVVALANRRLGSWRMSFELLPENAKVVELRAQLMGEQGALSEIWLYRWTG